MKSTISILFYNRIKKYNLSILLRCFSFRNKYKDDLIIMWAFEASVDLAISLSWLHRFQCSKSVDVSGCASIFTSFLVCAIFFRTLIIIDRRKDRCSKEKIIFSVFLLLFSLVPDGKIKYVNQKSEQQKISKMKIRIHARRMSWNYRISFSLFLFSSFNFNHNFYIKFDINLFFLSNLSWDTII